MVKNNNKHNDSILCAQCKKEIPNYDNKKSYYKCIKHDKYLCNDCIHAGLFCQRCEKTMHNKKSHPPEDEDVMLRKTMLIGTIALLITVILSFLFLSTFYAAFTTFSVTGYLIFIFISFFEIRRYPNKYYKRRTAHFEDRSIVNAFTGLLGDWTYPVLTEDERLNVFLHVREKINMVSIALILIGLILIMLGFFIITSIPAIIIGCIIIFTGIVYITTMRLAKRSYMGIEPIEITENTKLKAPKKGIILMEKLMDSINESYHKEIETQYVTMTYWMRAYKYIFENGNYIIFAYLKYPDTDLHSAVGIGYYLKYAIHAKEIFKKLDGILVENNIIELFNKDAYDYRTWGKL